MWAWYMRALGAHPLLTRTVTACVLTAAADVAAQAIERRGVVAPAPSWVPGRTLRLCAWSAAVTPVIALWFSALAALPSPVARMAADQLLFAPTSLAVFLWLQGAVEHGSAQAGGAALRAQFWQLLRANYLVWPMFAVCNFALVPPPLQVLSVGVASFFWSVYLSLALHAAPPHHAATVVDRLAALEPPYGLGHEMPATHALPAVPRLSRPNGTAAAAPALHLPRRDASRGASPAAGTPPAAGGAPTSRQQLK